MFCPIFANVFIVIYTITLFIGTRNIYKEIARFHNIATVNVFLLPNFLDKYGTTINEIKVIGICKIIELLTFLDFVKLFIHK